MLVVQDYFQPIISGVKRSNSLAARIILLFLYMYIYVFFSCLVRKNHNSFSINYLKDLNIVMATSFNPLNYKLVLLFGIHVSCQVVQSTRVSIPVPLALKNWPEFLIFLSTPLGWDVSPSQLYTHHNWLVLTIVHTRVEEGWFHVLKPHPWAGPFYPESNTLNTYNY